jgi:hypothetical protein
LVVVFLSATTYSWLPKRVEKAAIVKEGTLIPKKITQKRMRYYKSRRMLSFSCL